MNLESITMISRVVWLGVGPRWIRVESGPTGMGGGNYWPSWSSLVLWCLTYLISAVTLYLG